MSQREDVAKALHSADLEDCEWSDRFPLEQAKYRRLADVALAAADRVAWQPNTALLETLDALRRAWKAPHDESWKIRFMAAALNVVSALPAAPGEAGA